MKIIQVNEKIKIENYPYGRKTTTCYKWYEYKDGKGYRTCYQTVNPTTNKLNAPKKSAYSIDSVSCQILDLEKEIIVLNYQVNNEKQINLQCDLYKKVQEKEKELEKLKNELNK
tara:strand:+ start:1031 stop:1372 length:342 start_codon:yes stop_codon:yes gene_type:complete